VQEKSRLAAGVTDAFEVDAMTVADVEEAARKARLPET
jgi:hypothetical protein